MKADQEANEVPEATAADVAVTEEEQLEVVTSINRLLSEKYVFPDVAEKMAALLEQNVNDKKYSSLVDARHYADRLTKDLQSVSHDGHLRVDFDPGNVQQIRAQTEKEKEDDVDDNYEKLSESLLEELRFGNFGFKEIKILLGNIGYIDLRSFSAAQVAGETAVAAMNLVANCNALIFDLRNNNGGCPTMIQLLTSYLYDAEQKPVHLNSFYWRDDDTMEHFSTLPHVPGKRIGSNAEAYILTSKRTFSAAEEFTYNLKNLKRAVIVGETTGGGAHPGGVEIATDRFVVWVPKGRAINPITKTNWEGTGVEPDIKVAQEQALETAHVKALENLISKAKTLGNSENYQLRYERHLEILKAKLHH